MKQALTWNGEDWHNTINQSIAEWPIQNDETHTWHLFLKLWLFECTFADAKMTTDSSEYVQLRATEPIYGTELHHVNLLHSNQISIVPKDRSLYKSGCKWINVTPAKYSPVV